MLLRVGTGVRYLKGTYTGLRGGEVQGKAFQRLWPIGQEEGLLLPAGVNGEAAMVVYSSPEEGTGKQSGQVRPGLEEKPTLRGVGEGTETGHG